MQLELKALNQQLGTTFIYVTHDQEEALTMSDRIAVMDNARVAQLGTPAEIYENPRTAFVAKFIGESNFFDGRLGERGNGGGGGPRAGGGPFRGAPHPHLENGQPIRSRGRPPGGDVERPASTPPRAD